MKVVLCTTIVLLFSLSVYAQQVITKPESQGFGTGRGTSFCYLCDQSNADCNVVGEVDQDDVENTLFVCLCKPGYAGDGFVCESTGQCNKCGTITDAATAADKLLTGDIASCFLTYDGLAPGDTGSDANSTVFECACKPAFSGNGINCTNVNECEELTDWCDNNAKCVDTPGSFNCFCDTGFSTDDEGKTCTDINECAANPCGISNGAEWGDCTNKPGNYSCDCNPGFDLVDGVNQTCVDIDECSNDKDNECDKDLDTCRNTDGSYECDCADGYKKEAGRDSECIDIDECEEDIDDCGANTVCKNNNGSYTCDCVSSGYEQEDNRTCKDIDECVENTYTCEDKSRTKCVNTDGDYECDCVDGFELVSWKLFGGKVNQLCRDINECKTGDNNCHPFADCTDTEGSFTCACKDGFTGNGFMCEDINECSNVTETSIGPCDPNANCRNTNGSYVCTCIYGYEGNGKTCIETGGSVDDLTLNRTSLSEYAMRVNIHQEDVERRKLLVERQILLKKCAAKDLKENKDRTKRAVVEYDSLTNQEALIYLRTLESYNSALRLSNHAIEISCEVKIIGN